MSPICQHRRTKALYEYLGGNRFRNIATGVEGVLEDKIAREQFFFCMEATLVFEEYPLVKELVKKLELTLK